MSRVLLKEISSEKFNQILCAMWIFSLIYAKKEVFEFSHKVLHGKFVLLIKQNGLKNSYYCKKIYFCIVDTCVQMSLSCLN